MTLTELQSLLWFPLSLTFLVLSFLNMVEYGLDVRSSYKRNDPSPEREVSWSNFRNEIGRFVTAILFFILGVDAVMEVHNALISVFFFGTVLYKVWCGVKDRAMRDFLREVLQRKENGGGGDNE